MRRIFLIITLVCCCSHFSQGQVDLDAPRDTIDNFNYPLDNRYKDIKLRYDYVIFTSEYSLYKSSLKDRVVFRVVDFNQLASFEKVGFNEGLQISWSEFHKGLDLYENGLNYIDIENSKIKKRLIFSANNVGRASFFYTELEDILIAISKFNSIVIFKETIHKGKTRFYESEFNYPARFLTAFFQASLSFEGNTFYSNLEFLNTNFASNVRFVNSKFSEKVIFHNCKFTSNVDFDDSTLPDTIVFSKIKSTETIDLTNTKLDSTKTVNGQKCLINLINAPIEKFNFTYDNFRIYKPDTIPSILLYQQLNSVYEQLLKNFKNRGYTSSYKILDLEHQRFKTFQNPNLSTTELLIRKFLFYVNKLWHNHGYNKERIWGYTVIFLLLFSLLNLIFFPFLINEVYDIKQIRNSAPIDFFNSPVWRFKSAFFYTAIIFFGLKMSIGNINFKNGFGVFYIFFQYVVGLICLAYLINFIISSNLIGA